MTQTGTKLGLEIKNAPSTFKTVSAMDEPDSNSNVNAMDVAKLLWVRRTLLRRWLMIGLVIGAVVALLIPSRYVSTVQLMPPDNQSSGMAMLAALTAKTGGALGSVTGDILGVKSSGALFLGVLRSRTVQDRLVQRFNLKKAYSAKLEEDARSRLAENTTLSEDRKSGIITISVSDHDPRRAAAIAQAYVEELDHLVAQLSTSSARREREFLEERLTAVKTDLDKASKDFSQFASKSGAIDIKEQGRAMVEAAANLQGQLIATEASLSGLQQIYTQNNVRVRAAQAHVAELRNQLEKLGGKAGEEAVAGDDATAKSDAQYPSIRKLPILGVTYANLYRETKIQETVLEALTQQYEMAKVQEAKETPSVKVLDPAQVPERKSFPPRTLITLLIAMAAVACAGAWVIFQQRWLAVSADNAGKTLATEIVHSMNAQMPWAPPNGSRFQAAAHGVWKRVVRRGNSEKAAE